MARLLIPSELRNPFPSNSLNRSVSSFSTFALLLRLLVFFVSHLSQLALPAPVFKDLITDSSLILSTLPRSPSLIRQDHPPPSSLLFTLWAPSSSCLASAASSIGAGMRSSPFHGRETRLRRKGGVKEERAAGKDKWRRRCSGDGGG